MPSWVGPFSAGWGGGRISGPDTRAPTVGVRIVVLHAAGAFQCPQGRCVVAGQSFGTLGAARVAVAEEQGGCQGGLRVGLGRGAERA